MIIPNPLNEDGALHPVDSKDLKRLRLKHVKRKITNQHIARNCELGTFASADIVGIRGIQKHAPCENCLD